MLKTTFGDLQVASIKMKDKAESIPCPSCFAKCSDTAFKATGQRGHPSSGKHSLCTVLGEGLYLSGLQHMFYNAKLLLRLWGGELSHT